MSPKSEIISIIQGTKDLDELFPTFKGPFTSKQGSGGLSREVQIPVYIKSDHLIITTSREPVFQWSFIDQSTVLYPEINLFKI